MEELIFGDTLNDLATIFSTSFEMNCFKTKLQLQGKYTNFDNISRKQSLIQKKMIELVLKMLMTKYHIRYVMYCISIQLSMYVCMDIQVHLCGYHFNPFLTCLIK